MQVHDCHASTRFDAPPLPCAGTREQRLGMLSHELRHIAQQLLRRNNGDGVLTPGRLLDETFLSLVQRDAVSRGSRAEFLSDAAPAMRGMIVEYLRQCRARTCGNGFELTPLDATSAAPGHELQASRLSAAVDALTHIDARLAECIDLHFFCGFSFEEIAILWQVPLRTVRRDWDKARFLLSTLMDDEVAASCTACTS